MTDKIPFLKNKIDNIHVPTEKLDEIILKTVQNHAPKRKRSLSKKIIYSASAIVATFGLLLGSTTVSPTMASIVSKIPIIGSIFSEFGDPGLVQMSEQGLTQIIGESKKVGDKSLTIEEVFYDGTRFTLSYSLESEKTVSEAYINSMDFTVNGERIAYGVMHQITDSIPTHHTGIVMIDTLEDLPKEFPLHVVFKGVGGEKWEFLLPIHTNTNVETIVTNYEQKVAGIHLFVTDIINGPAGLKVKYKKEFKEDALQKKLSEYLGFRIEDDLGNELTFNTGSSAGFSEDGEVNLEGNEIFDPISSDAKVLTIYPYFNLPKDGVITEVDSEGNETVIDLTIFESEELKFESFTVPLNKK